MCAQASHASSGFIRNKMLKGIGYEPHELEWLLSPEHAKIVCKVDSENELMGIAQQALDAGLNVYVVTDFGLTEFKGVHTKTCLAIGPDCADRIDQITKHLGLL